jgi:hypothetical protein
MKVNFKMIFLFCINLGIENIYGENFVSYSHLQEQLKSGKYSGVLIKFGTDRCPPCKALDKGPLDKLEGMINKKLADGKKILIIVCNLEKDKLQELFIKLNINSFKKIPAIFVYGINKDDSLVLKYKTTGYDTGNPEQWLNEISNEVVTNLK